MCFRTERKGIEAALVFSGESYRLGFYWIAADQRRDVFGDENTIHAAEVTAEIEGGDHAGMIGDLHQRRAGHRFGRQR